MVGTFSSGCSPTEYRAHHQRQRLIIPVQGYLDVLGMPGHRLINSVVDGPTAMCWICGAVYMPGRNWIGSSLRRDFRGIRRKFVLPWIPSKFETGYATAFSHKTHLSGAFMGGDSLSMSF